MDGTDPMKDILKIPFVHFDTSTHHSSISKLPDFVLAVTQLVTTKLFTSSMLFPEQAKTSQ